MNWRWFKRIAFGALLATWIVSVTGNVLIYRRVDATYRLLSDVQLDPYGLKRPNFPPDPPPSPAGEVLPVVMFLGDSRARSWPAPSAAGLRFINRGIGGQTTEQVRGRFDAHVAVGKPLVVVLQAGINDLKAIGLYPHRRNQIIADCKANLRQIVDRARAQGSTVILTTVFPVGDVTLDRTLVWSADIEQAVVEVNADLRMWASDRVVVLDAWTLLETNGRLREEYGVDTLHLSEQGYGVLNLELAKVLGTVMSR